MNLGIQVCTQMINAYLDEVFEERHQKRLDMITKMVRTLLIYKRSIGRDLAAAGVGSGQVKMTFRVYLKRIS